ncbi:hypothetical protein Y032_0603g536 [Ancylostoma ceylanicum]|uniref:Uncharacterized protein n=1 Tax=Ancylostoma ceylanicum TaxID=53326 RepID=A0A016WM42_9BILA|nr:hypothetical protein Y032_0603g536 [Ancylostoma ceylanicum]
MSEKEINSGYVQVSGNKEKNMLETTKENVSDAGKTVVDTAQKAYDSMAKKCEEAKSCVLEKAEEANEYMNRKGDNKVFGQKFYRNFPSQLWQTISDNAVGCVAYVAANISPVFDTVPKPLSKMAASESKPMQMYNCLFPTKRGRNFDMSHPLLTFCRKKLLKSFSIIEN